MISTQQHADPDAPALPDRGVLDDDDFRDPGFLADPFPVLARLRAAAPVHPITLPGGRRAWLVTRFQDASRLLKDPRVSTLPPPGHAAVARSAFSLRLARPSMLETDPADHARLRGLVSRAFTPRYVEGLRPRVQAIADELIDAALPRGRMELIADFAFPLPITVICEMLGIPARDHARLREWSAMLFDPFSLREEPDSRAKGDAFAEYIEDLIETKRRAPQDDLVSRLVQAEDAGDTLTQTELRAMLVLLIFAGHETTVNLLGNGLLALLTHPRQLDALKRDPSLVPAAVEELLRCCGPAMTPLLRYAVDTIALGDTTIPRGEVLVISLASADRDPARFPDAETLDVARADCKHLAFGHGVHFCLGAPLARLEAQVALATLLGRLPGLRLDASPDTLRWRGNLLIRGLHALPVAF